MMTRTKHHSPDIQPPAAKATVTAIPTAQIAPFGLFSPLIGRVFSAVTPPPRDVSRKTSRLKPPRATRGVTGTLKTRPQNRGQGQVAYPPFELFRLFLTPLYVIIDALTQKNKATRAAIPAAVARSIPEPAVFDGADGPALAFANKHTTNTIVNVSETKSGGEGIKPAPPAAKNAVFDAENRVNGGFNEIKGLKRRKRFVATVAPVAGMVVGDDGNRPAPLLLTLKLMLPYLSP